MWKVKRWEAWDFVWVLLIGLLLSGCQQSLASAPAAIVMAVTEVPVLNTATSAALIASASPTPTNTPHHTQATTPQPQTSHLTPTSKPTRTPEPPTFTSIRDTQIAGSAVANSVPFVLANKESTGIWQFDEQLFIHPIALDVHKQTAFMLDAGRVLAFDLTAPSIPHVLLPLGDDVESVTVLEPLDLDVMPDGLLVLDRAGDVYFYDWIATSWQLDRFDRPSGESSGHYSVAVAGEGNGRYLLETNYQYVRLYGDDVRNRLWPIIESRAVDIAVSDDDVFVLSQSLHDQTGILAQYRDTAYVSTFRPAVEIVQPRQVVVGKTAVYILDTAGKRLLTLDRSTGTLQTITQTPPQTSAFTIDPTTGNLLFAGGDRLYFFNQPDQQAQISGGPVIFAPLSHNPIIADSLTNFSLPIMGTKLTQRDFQMPGAPRHYRLGVHQGLDFYWRPGTAVYAIAPGKVIRATHNYEPITRNQVEQLRTENQELTYTSEAALDIYRGRQVWIEHDNGIITRYIHLSAIDPSIEVGSRITQGQKLGEVGNSGSPSSLTSRFDDSHLHFEIWVGDFYLGQFLRPIETRNWIEQLFVIGN
ncbi:MAG: hypothetical protein DWQ04_01610 [Chloroflexi bacterium]|nr:MAG: hypothetical protein DWQ04_01610 [Chloroflexota bacterium]